MPLSRRALRQAVEKLKQRDVEGLADLMDQNFNVRRRPPHPAAGGTTLGRGRVIPVYGLKFLCVDVASVPHA